MTRSPIRLASAGYLPAAVCWLAFAVLARATPILPNINTNNIITITNAPYNAVGDGATDNTLAISNAIAKATAGGNTNGLFGGTVRIPAPGTYLTGPLTLKKNVDLQIDSGATLQMQPLSVWTNLPAQSETYGNLLYASSATNLEISGAGTIDGNGAAWWDLPTTGDVYGNRPYMIYFNGNCGRVLVQGVTVQNPPKMHFVFKGGGDGNITFQGMTINTTAANAANTDGIDLVGTNCLIQNCTINAGDDNIALGSSDSSAYSVNILVTNCAFGQGHGVSIGSNTAGAVSNLTVINCTFNGTDYGIRMKSDDATGGGSGEGGLAQNLSYLNLSMSNIVDGAIVIYSYYSEYGTPTEITPFMASTQMVASTKVPVWRNIVISNLTATVADSGIPGIIWARLEVPATNILLDRVNITGPQPFEVYNASGVQFIDSQITPPAGSNNYLFFNAQVTVSNTLPDGNVFTFDGLTTNVPGSVMAGNTLAFYNASAWLQDTNALGAGALTLGGGTLTVSNNLTLSPSSVLNFQLGTNATTINVVSNLTLGGTFNITNGPGFTNDTYTLLSYGKSLAGSLPGLETALTNYTYSLDTNLAGQVNLVAGLAGLAAPANLIATATNLMIDLSWDSVPGATNYDLFRGTTNGGPYPTIYANLTGTNYADANVTNAVEYYYVVTALGTAGESTNSLPASAVPLPSSQPTNLSLMVGNGSLLLSWPQDHLGWLLQTQTNNLSVGISTNWFTVPYSTNIDATNIVINPSSGAVFYRLVYP